MGTIRLVAGQGQRDLEPGTAGRRDRAGSPPVALGHLAHQRETETGAVVMGTSDRWTLRVGDEEAEDGEGPTGTAHEEQGIGSKGDGQCVLV